MISVKIDKIQAGLVVFLAGNASIWGICASNRGIWVVFAVFSGTILEPCTIPPETIEIMVARCYFVTEYIIMKETNLLFRPEDEMDFIPIIPLNENDADDGQDIVMPRELPLLPLRNTVLFPGVVLPITVGRDKSIKAVNEAYKADKLVGVVAQKDSNVEDPSITDRKRWAPWPRLSSS